MSKIDIHERKTLEALTTAFPTSEISSLKIGDFLLVTSEINVEIKIGQDVHDYARMGDELTRMNLPEYAHLKKHLIYVAPMEIWAFHEYKIVVGFCCRANVYPHHEPTIEKMIRKIKSLTQPAYQRPLQMSKESSKELRQLGKIIATFPGISDFNAAKIEDLMTRERQTLCDALFNVLGSNKDGELNKVSRNVVDFFQSLRGFLE